MLLEVYFALTGSQVSAEGKQTYSSFNVNHVLTSCKKVDAEYTF